MSSSKLFDNVMVCDSTLRDGNHAVVHQLSADNIRAYAKAIDRTGVSVVEIGHGNGLGASSLHVGMAALTDAEMIIAARKCVKVAKLGVVSIPGFSTVDRDLKPAIDLGVDEVRVGAHCTEADVTRQQIAVLAASGVGVKGMLLMTHMVSADKLLGQAKLMQDYGAEGVIIMDSAGTYSRDDVVERISLLTDQLDVPIGFHAHDNRGLAISNSLAAVDAGAKIIDVTAKGFGAGAGNTPIELMAANLYHSDDQVDDLLAVFHAVGVAEREFIRVLPANDDVTISSGIAGVFSGFSRPVVRISEMFGVDPRLVLMELGRRRVVAGQEDMIAEVAQSLRRASIDA